MNNSLIDPVTNSSSNSLLWDCRSITKDNRILVAEGQDLFKNREHTEQDIIIYQEALAHFQEKADNALKDLRAAEKKKENTIRKGQFLTVVLIGFAAGPPGLAVLIGGCMCLSAAVQSCYEACVTFKVGFTSKQSNQPTIGPPSNISEDLELADFERKA